MCAVVLVLIKNCSESWQKIVYHKLTLIGSYSTQSYGKITSNLSVMIRQASKLKYFEDIFIWSVKETRKTSLWAKQLTGYLSKYLNFSVVCLLHFLRLWVVLTKIRMKCESSQLYYWYSVYLKLLIRTRWYWQTAELHQNNKISPSVLCYRLHQQGQPQTEHLLF